jgi:hypothetical protein
LENQNDITKEATTDTKETTQSPPCPGIHKTESRQTTAATEGQ